MLSALSSHWLYLSPGLAITTVADTISTLEVAPTITLFMPISTTTPAMQVVLGMGITARGMGITITTAGTGTALAPWLVLP